MDSAGVLLVENNPVDTRRFIESFRADIGFALVEAKTVDEARPIVQSGDYALILLNLRLPDSEGLSTFQAVQAVSADTPIVVLVSPEDEGLALEAIGAGAEDYVLKGEPGSGRLEGVVRRAIERKHMAEDLARVNQVLDDKVRLIDALTEVGQRVLETLDLDDVLDILSRQIVEAGIFRSIMVALVGQQAQEVEVVRALRFTVDANKKVTFVAPDAQVIGTRYRLDDENVTAQVARTGERFVIDTFEDLRLDRRYDNNPDVWRGKVAYFIPVKRGEKVLAVLATGSTMAEKADTLRRIDVLQPLLDQFGIALENACLYRELNLSKQDLAESEARFRQLTTHIRDVFWLTDISSGQILFASPAYESIWGRKVRDLYADSLAWVAAIHEEERATVEAAFEHACQSGSPFDVRYRILQPNGTERWIHGRGFPILGEDGKPTQIAGIAEDITLRVQTEKEQVHLVRMHALGEMSAGVSHNLNNILTSVLGPAQIIERIAEDERVLREAKDIIRAATQTAELVKQLHYSVRGNIVDVLEPVVLNDAVRDVVRLTTARWKDEAEARGIAIEVGLELGDVPPLCGTLVGVHDILINLIFNAIDAMPSGGKLTFGSRMLKNRVLLSVKDNGKGMTEDVRQRVFDPFFTTRIGVGTGMGLSTVYNTMAQWEGSIDVESTPGEGTTFFLNFPVWDDSISEPQVSAGNPHQEGRLLIVDDHLPSAQTLERLLGTSHAVEVATSAQDALAKSTAGVYDAALIDLSMPGMPGDQVARILKTQNPALVTVLVTGWFLDKEDPRRAPFDLEIQKPFRDFDLVIDVVDQALTLHRTKK